MRTAGRWLLVGWLVAALLVLGMDGRLPAFLAWALPGSALVLGVGALAPQQLAPSCYNRPSIPERYRVADDLGQPLAAVVAAAEQEAITGAAGCSARPARAAGRRCDPHRPCRAGAALIGGVPKDPDTIKL
jgi:hypothetical protein